MLDDYKRAMNRVKASDEFKSELMQKLDTLENSKQRFTFKPYIVSAAAAAVIALVVLGSATLSPLLTDNSVPDTQNVINDNAEYYASDIVTRIENYDKGITSYEIGDEEYYNVSGSIQRKDTAQSCIVYPNDSRRVYIVSEIIHKAPDDE